MAFSSSSYMRKRLPQPKARIETFAFVRPSVRLGSEAIVGWASTIAGKSERPTPAVVRPTRSRNFLRDKSFLMGTSPARENDCSAEPRKRRGSPRVGRVGSVRQCGKERLRKCGTQQVRRIALVTAFLKARCHSRRWEFM